MAPTVRSMVAVWVTDPNVPVIVTVVVPGTALLLAVNVKTVLLPVGFWEKAAATPSGSPETLDPRLL